jgi:phosphoglycerate kinase
MADYLTLDDVDVAGRRVLVRADLNVPLDHAAVADDFRLLAFLPTVERLRAAGAVTVLCSHLGRPKNREAEFSMDPVAARLSALGDFAVRKLDAVVGPEVEAAIAAGRPGDVILLENTRFERGETKNDPALSAALARLGDLFVQDAFGSAHRAHSSTVGVAELVKSVAGPLLVAEVESLGRLLHDPPRPFVVVMGGAKLSDKLAIIHSLLPKTDVMLIGGGMCFTFLAAEGYEIGKSLVEEDMIKEVRKLLAGEGGDRVQLPLDIVVGERFAEDAVAKTVAADQIPESSVGLDIGPLSVERFAGVVAGAASVFWNGPMGVFEWSQFRSGTEGVAKAVAASAAFTAVGGGDSVAALRMLGLDRRVDHLSTGGGASLELLEGKPLPGVLVLKRWAHGA